MKTIEMKLTGKTYEIKEALKKQGWKWNKAENGWTKTVQVPDEIAKKVNGYGKQIPEGREFAKTFNANKKGCICTSGNGCTVWFRSNEYAEKINPAEERAAAKAQAAHDKMWHSVNGMPTHKNLLDDPDYL